MKRFTIILFAAVILISGCHSVYEEEEYKRTDCSHINDGGVCLQIDMLIGDGGAYEFDG